MKIISKVGRKSVCVTVKDEYCRDKPCLLVCKNVDCNGKASYSCLNGERQIKIIKGE